MSETIIRCERCSERLNPKTLVWLELSQTDGKYYRQIPEGHVSQGAFTFGSACAKIETGEKEIQIQSVGRMPAKPASEFKPGEFFLWNFGSIEQVIAIVEETAKSIIFKTQYFSQGSLQTIERRRFLKTRLIAISNAKTLK